MSNEIREPFSGEPAAVYSRPRTLVREADRPQRELIASPRIQSCFYKGAAHLLIAFGGGQDRTRFPFAGYVFNQSTRKITVHGPGGEQTRAVPAPVARLFETCSEHSELLPSGTNVHGVAFGQPGAPTLIYAMHYTPRFTGPSNRAKEAAACVLVEQDSLNLDPLVGTHMHLAAVVALALREACRTAP